MHLGSVELAGPHFTKHALAQMRRRGIHPGQVAGVVEHGRRVHTRGADIFVVGRKEVRWCQQQGIQVDELQGLHVVCASDTGAVITAYRNFSMRGLRPCRRGRTWRRRVEQNLNRVLEISG